jgi:hypothetical protein
MAEEVISPEHETDYDSLIDRTIKDFKPVNRLWSAGTRLLFWTLLESAILALTVVCLGWDEARSLIHQSSVLLAIALLICGGFAAAFLALRGAIPGRGVTWAQLAVLIAVVSGAVSVGLTLSPVAEQFHELLDEGITSTLDFLALAAVPWLTLFWAVRRGVPLQPAKTGALVGLAASCWALADHRLISEAGAWSNHVLPAVFAGILVTCFSAVAGTFFLDWIGQCRDTCGLVEMTALKTIWPTARSARTVFPVALSVSGFGLIFLLNSLRQSFAPISNFDLAIENYERSLSGFRSNIPSNSIDTMLTAYIADGMPAYMWDFGPEGFKLVGGRWEPLPDGTPATYTWFHGAKGGVMCMIRQVDEFKPPARPHQEHNRLLFYKYHGFSLCLINIGGYGNFICVVATRMPLEQFMSLVFAADD